VCGFGGSVGDVRPEDSFSSGGRISLFYSESSGVRSGDSGLDSPEAQRPRGRSIGHGRGVDKGDEFSMQPSGALAPDCSYVASPRRDPNLLSYVVPLVESPTSVCLVCPFVPAL